MTSENKSDSVVDTILDVLTESIKRVCTNTVCSADLPKNKKELVEGQIGCGDGEYLRYVYMRTNDFDRDFHMRWPNIFVGITNRRLFKVEDGKCESVYIHNIKSVKHQKNGVFSWDKIVCEMKDGKTETMGVYHSEACEFFCDKLKEMF